MTAQKSMNPAPAATGGLIDLINKTFTDLIKNAHTQIPAKVININYKECWVDVQPLIETPVERNYLGEITEMQYPIIYKVPIKILSAGRGRARVTMPIKQGDVGNLVFSERDTDTYLNTKGEDIQPSNNFNVLSLEGKPYRLCFEGETFTPSTAKEIHPEDIVIENENSKINLKPSGEVVISFNGKTLTFNPSSGDITHSSGCAMKSDGDITTSEGYSLRQLWEKTFSHTHDGVQPGSGVTGDITSA